MSYDEADSALAGAGFALDLYGGTPGGREAYAIYVHPCGVVATVDYVYAKAGHGTDSWTAADVNGIYGDYDPGYRRWSTVRPAGYVPGKKDVRRVMRTVMQLGKI